MTNLSLSEKHIRPESNTSTRESLIKFAGKIADAITLKINFPEWRLSHLRVGRAVYNNYVEIAREMDLYTETPVSPDQALVSKTLTDKRSNALGVVGAYTQGKEFVNEDYVSALVGSELTIVDLPDDISEGVTHSFENGTQLYQNALRITGDSTEVAMTGIPQPYADLMFGIGEKAREGVKSVLDKIGDKYTQVAVKRAISGVVWKYGNCVELMHMPENVEREAEFAHLKDELDMPLWFAESAYGYLSWGSPLEVYALLYESEFNRDFGATDVNRLGNLYATVPLIHTFLDGLADYERDIEKKSQAPNLVELLISGKLDQELKIMQMELTGVIKEVDSGEEKLILFAELLSGFYRQAEKHFLLDSGTLDRQLHRQVVRDLVKFHQIQLARFRGKSNNLGRVMKRFAKVLGKA